jgi:hypothetical protein
MVTVVETWRLKAEFEDRVLDLMQVMDDIVGPAAHVDAGWREHGRFFQLQERPTEVWMIYTWGSRAEHEEFMVGEDKRIADFTAEFCEGPRDVTYFTELPVDVD